MRANAQFTKLDMKFWPNVKTIGQAIGYSKNKQVRSYDFSDLLNAMEKAKLGNQHLIQDNHSTDLANILINYFDYRRSILISYVEPRLMDVDKVSKLYTELLQKLQPTAPLPMNKQRGEKKQHAFLTGIVNMIIEANADGILCDYDPRILTTFTHNDEPLRTLSRRVDGCFPSCVNPIAIWEIKEYDHTRTFGSRIADGVYETLLDGLELNELSEHENIGVEHLLIIDSRRTWWTMGISYLCRIIDMLHMGYVDEVLFGYEVIERLPDIVQNWVKLYHQNN